VDQLIVAQGHAFILPQRYYQFRSFKNINRIAAAFFSAVLLAGAMFAQAPVAGVDYPAPYPVPFVGFTVSTGSDPLLCTPGFNPGGGGAPEGSPLNYRTDLAAFKFCSAKNTWSLFGTANGALVGTTLTASGAAALSSTLGVTGVTTPTGGIAQSTATVPFTQFMSPVPYLVAGIASSTDPGSSLMGLTEIFIPSNATLTGACMLMGSGASTDKWFPVLYNSAGTALANGALTGATLGTASTLNCQAFLATAAVVGPQTYYIGIQTNGTTANEIYLYATGSLPTNYGCGQVADTFGTVAAVTVPTTFTAAKCGPVAVY
jgi:hypothetical protein